MRWYMDIWFNRRDGGVELIGPDKWIIHNNWKNSADNFIGDMYHAVLSHRSAIIVMMKKLGISTSALSNYDRPGNQVSPGNGHGCFTGVYAKPEELLDMARGFQDPALVEYQQSIHEEMVRRLGPNRAGRIGPEHSSLFPNMSWLPNGTVRLWHPRGPLATEVWSFTFADKAMPEEAKGAWRRECIRAFGPSGLLEQDDMDNWRNASDAGRSFQARKYAQVISMGVGHEHNHPDLPGRSAPNTYSEINQRSFYERWQEFMNAQSWAQVHIDPITATFEGTATMKG